MEPCDDIRHDCEGRFEALEATKNGRKITLLQGTCRVAPDVA